MKSNVQQINNLRQVIYNALDPLIKSDYCLLDVPDYSNIGDSLIYAGELAYLSRLPYKEIYSSNITRCRLDRIPKGCTILLQGGGNFGDLYRGHQNFRNQVISRFKGNRIILFPQTIHYKGDVFLKQDADIHNDHPDLTLCVRDEKSYDFLKKHFSKTNIILLPDMAFCLNSIPYSDKLTNRKLLFKRTDHELNESYKVEDLVGHSSTSNVDISDWPVYDRSLVEKLIYKADAILSDLLLDVPVLNSLIDPKFGIKGSKTYERLIAIGVNFLDKYDEVFSTRLHGTILAILMDKKVHVIDNSYGKNSGFYKAWLKDFNNVELILESD